MIVNALLALKPEAKWSVPNSGSVSDIEWITEGARPSDAEIEAKITELQAEYDSKQYQRDRLAEYPTIEELVVALYDEEDKASIIERRNAVKAKYPKPE